MKNREKIKYIFWNIKYTVLSWFTVKYWKDRIKTYRNRTRHRTKLKGRLRGAWYALLGEPLIETRKIIRYTNDEILLEGNKQLANNEGITDYHSEFLKGQNNGARKVIEYIRDNKIK